MVRGTLSTVHSVPSALLPSIVQWCPSIKADIGVAGDQGVLDKTGILDCVDHFHHMAEIMNDVGAQCVSSGCFCGTQARLGLEPLTSLDSFRS